MATQTMRSGLKKATARCTSDSVVVSRTASSRRLVVPVAAMTSSSRKTALSGVGSMRKRRGAHARETNYSSVICSSSRRGALVVTRAAADKSFDTSKIRIGEEGLIIETYAESLLQAAMESGDSILKKVASDMDSLLAAVSSEDFVTYLNDPTVEIADKVSTIKEAAKTLGWHEFTVNVAEILLERNRAEVIVDLPDAFKMLYNALQKTMRVEVISAVKLSNEQTFKIVSTVQKMTGASNVKCKNLVDPEIEAGLVVKYGEDLDSLIDLTVTKDFLMFLNDFETDVSAAFWESIRADDDFPVIPSMPEFNDALDYDSFTSVCAGNSYLNNKFNETLDSGDKQMWNDRVRIA